MIGVVPNHVSGGHYPATGLRIAASVLSDDKEGRLYSILLQYVQNLRGVRFVGAVIKGQCHPEAVAVAIRTHLAIESGARVDSGVGKQGTYNTDVENVNEPSHYLDTGADIQPKQAKEK